MKMSCILNNAVNSAIEASWKQDIKDKSSLKYVNIHADESW